MLTVEKIGGTSMSQFENVLKNIFGIDKFKIIDAETEHPGELIPCKGGYQLVA